MFIDGSCTPAKKGRLVANTKRGKGTKIMAIADASVLPVAIDIQSASLHEIKLVEGAIKNHFIKRFSKRMIGDKAYDSDTVDQRLSKMMVRS
jgi:hypothetical protein